MPRKSKNIQNRIKSAMKMNALMRSRRASKKEGNGNATTSAQNERHEDLIKMETLCESHESAGPSVTIEMECKDNVPTMNAQIIMGEDTVHMESLSESQQSVDSFIALETACKDNDHTTSSQITETEPFQMKTSSEPQQSVGSNIRGRLRSKRASKKEGNGKATTSAQKNIHEDLIKIKTSSEPQQSVGFNIRGRRIIDVVYFYSQLQEISKHGPMNCGLGCVEIVGERQAGLRTTFKLECNMCYNTFFIESDPPGEINVNHSAVAGIVAIVGLPN